MINIRKSERWYNLQLKHYAPAVEGRTDPARYHIFVDKYLGPPPLSIVDCGCAGGDITEDLWKKGHTVVGIDYPEVIEKTKQRHSVSLLDLTFIPYDLNEGLPEGIIDFDWIYASEILEHITHDFDFLCSCYECLKPSGKIYVTVPRVAEKWNGHLRFYPVESIRNLLWAAGFEIFAEDKDFSSTIVIGEKR